MVANIEKICNCDAAGNLDGGFGTVFALPESQIVVSTVDQSCRSIFSIGDGSVFHADGAARHSLTDLDITFTLDGGERSIGHGSVGVAAALKGTNGRLCQSKSDFLCNIQTGDSRVGKVERNTFLNSQSVEGVLQLAAIDGVALPGKDDFTGMSETAFGSVITTVEVHQIPFDFEGSGTGDKGVAGGAAAGDGTVGGRGGGQCLQIALDNGFGNNCSGSLDRKVLIGTLHDIAAGVVNSAEINVAVTDE